mmetsp:Transcript_11552/g.10018  ORF Transcript_11552/g.10018 Transcript_11552/m.10018 type:complete len:175 (-) Transcript_11552:157-681(-)|eukprot:CAMPEP_0114580226 /NCGR_PEP_ID=MMETSP0125-20121206/4560_1 /TAXON_ID=485358 ORGANISM="Aristerostoma sp., Strain ATCC 50986" /NCGR_SAMPLE_ID=MMETSP0125 /ASSEMBLY_ACC=CAM_ASM_000245 /LENGTH=174 /DNA_ID=CAMNT_0001771673 /DNA_START=535 /DNA_END=1059 /DNA_ORIENTATION=-
MSDSKSLASTTSKGSHHFTFEKSASAQKKKKNYASSSNLDYKSRPLENSCWGEEYHEALKELAPQFNFDWNKISRKFFLKVNKKFSTHLLRTEYRKLKAQSNAPKNKPKFNEEMDVQIIQAVNQYGLDWTKISLQFEGFSRMTLKNRYYNIKRNGTLKRIESELGTQELHEHSE